MNSMSTIRRDFIASHLRSQLNMLNRILSNIEEEDKVACDYAHESLKEIEANLRQIRKLCMNN
jgi:hypothetical protein